MNELTFNDYREFECALDTEIGKTAESFVRIGYLLKVARDTDILQQSEYSSVVEMAKARYGLDKTQVSRFIHINDRFAENGNSEQLEERFRGMGYAKLTIMLQLPDELNEEITQNFTKAEIQTLKEEVEEEKKVSDIEVMMESPVAVFGDNLEKAIIQLGEDEPWLYKAVFNALQNNEDVKEAMLPTEERIYSIRIKGIGRVMLSLKESEENVTLINIRNGEKTSYQMLNVIGAWQSVMDLVGTDATEEYERVYGKPFPVQHIERPISTKTEPKREEPKKEAPKKVVPAKKMEQKREERKPAPVPVEQKKVSYEETEEEESIFVLKILKTVDNLKDTIRAHEWQIARNLVSEVERFVNKASDLEDDNGEN